ncbi:hypothetical protein CMV30_11980 [Nibricoccus aquaticus]|uniref:Aldose epimerase n=1 Tax=Nibricoccus aquaticus TaxID=2576891 RepID=A0A290Q8P8_9BACT|nr:hypothetical protein [Nibricoccus aquaticus]ATC64617.1 hypothetical protein CMV30_11980 [Nibricoccus aquaticus]
MLHLANARLRVDILDPQESGLNGVPRFCPAGFIWQVHHVTAGPLLAGPEWPNPTPDPFNGQGLPEAFRHRTREGSPLTWKGDEGLAVGTGVLKRSSTGETTLVSRCEWEIIPLHERALFKTTHEALGHRYELLRLVELQHSSLISVSSLANQGDSPITLQWFAHPFFTLTEGLIKAGLPDGTSLAENPGFALSDNCLTQKRRFHDVKDGHFDQLKLPAEKNLEARLSHPALNQIDFSTSFPPDECVIWGNANTFSIEPYLSITLAPGEVRQWQLRYDFGMSSGTSSPSFNSRTPAP